MVMKIAGLQKVSTIDYVGEICCVVFLWGCNFRCGFCYNPELVLDCEVAGRRSQVAGFPEDYVLDFLSRRVGKLDAVCISGGEPLMSLDFDFVRKIRAMGFKIKIDTNGSFPERLQEIVDLGLVDYIAMDVKSCREDYSDVAGVEVDLEKIEESIKLVHEFGGRGSVVGSRKGDSEFRTTVVPGLHDSEKMVRMGEWMGEVCGEKPGKIFLQGFRRTEAGMIDSSFLEKGDFLDGDLVRLKGDIDTLFQSVGIRY